MAAFVKPSDYLFNDLADPLMKDSFLIATPWPLLTIIGIYLYAIYFYLPKHMEKRKPYNVDGIIRVYNVFQVCTCVYLVHQFLNTGWLSGKYKIVGCYARNYSDPEENRILAGAVWLTLVLKMTELLDTVFFVLRKKYNQVSFLHVYHHSTTLMIGWLGSKYIPGGTTTASVMANCSVHVVMYSYYLLSSFGPTMRKRLSFAKKYITVLQIIQLIAITIHSSQLLRKGCPLDNALGYVFVTDAIINVALFLNFYAKSYSSKKKRID